MEEEFSFAQQVPGLSFNAKRRNPYSYEFLSRPFDMGENRLPSSSGSNAKGNQTSLYAAIGAIGDSLPQAKRDENFMNSVYGRAAFGQRRGVAKGFDTGEKALGAIPIPITQAIAGFSKLGRGIGRQTTNEYGIYKNKFSEMVDNSFNPERGLTQSIGAVKDVFNGGGLDGQNLLNLGTMGILGQSSEQRKAKRMKTLYNLDKATQQMTQNEMLGKKIGNMIPAYQAPAYGRNGMKFKSKLSTY